MNIRPTIEEVRTLAAESAYGAVPLSCEILSDLCTPIEVLRILRNVSGHVYLLEKNMVSNIRILGSKKAEIPLVVKATQRVTSLQTQGVTPLSPSQITRRLKREIVEIY